MKALKQVGAAIGLVHDPLLQYRFERDPSKSPGLRCGHNGLWSVHPAVDRATEESVSVFILSLDEVDRRCASPGDGAELARAIRKGAETLQRLRHPQVLRVIKPLVEDKSRRRWVFATEPIVCGLEALCNEA